MTWKAGSLQQKVGVAMPVTRRMVLGGAVAGTALTLASCNGVTNAGDTLRIGHTLDTAHPVHRAMERIAERTAELSGGALRIAIYPNGQLGSEREMIELLQLGALDITKVSTSPLEGFSPQMQVFSLPYLFRDPAHYWQVLESPIGQDLLLSMKDVRLRGLCYFDAGARSFYTTETVVRSPADLAGLKIRVMNSQSAIATIEALGGEPTTIGWGELYTALQQGVVDGAENNPPTLLSSRQHELIKSFTLDEHSSIPDVLLIGTESWNRLSQAQRGWLSQAVSEGVTYQRALWETATVEALGEIAASGVEIIRPDKAPFQKAVVPLLASFAGTPTGRLIEQIRSFGREERK